ncbi:MAG: TusE/DsrC/DsvC family sulfur relay protein, partial [Candidatus Polarisedimenticolia bacterium]
MVIGEKEIALDGNGFLVEPQSWNHEVAVQIAKDEGIAAMSDKHWAVVDFIREYWMKTDMAPAV